MYRNADCLFLIRLVQKADFGNAIDEIHGDIGYDGSLSGVDNHKPVFGKASRISTFGFFSKARAMQSRCFCPPETFVPPCSI